MVKKTTRTSVLYPNTPDEFIAYCNVAAKYDIMSYEKLSTIESTEKEKDKETAPIVTIKIVCGVHSKDFTLAEGLSMEQIEEINKHI